MFARTSHSRKLTVALVAVGAVAFVACGGDDDAGRDPDSSSTATDDTAATDGSGDVDESPDDGVHLLASGSADSLPLPVPYEVGQTAESEIQIDMDISADTMGEEMDVGVGMAFSVTQAVAAATSDETTIEMTINSVDVTDAPADTGSDVEAQFDALAGEVLVLRYGANGEQIGETELKSGEEMPEELAASLSSTTSQVLFPTEPVGVGAEWTAVVPMDSSGMAMDVETTYELTELTASEYVITMKQDTAVDSEVDGTDVTGTITGTGEVRGSRTNPLVQRMTYDQDADMTMGDSGDLSMIIGVEMTSR